MTPTPITDAEIVAFLDDALPSEDQARIALASAERPDVAQRIEELSMDKNALSDAFDGLLNSAPTPSVAVTSANRNSAPLRWWQAVAAVALLAIGIGIGTQIPLKHAPDWHMAVADYQVLYATQTLTGMELTEDQRWGSLAKTSELLGLKITREDVTLSGLQFRRAQILSHNGAPLAQLAFLDDHGNAIAFCFTRTDGPDQEPQSRELAGLGTVTWQKNGMGFILIGGSNPSALTAWQQKLSANTQI